MVVVIPTTCCYMAENDEKYLFMRFSFHFVKITAFVHQHVEERPAGGGHDRESGGSGSAAGQREAGVSG